MLGSAVPLLLLLVLWALAALVVYWIIRLAVRHGTLDAYRIDRVDQRIAAMKARPGSGPSPDGGSMP